VTLVVSVRVPDGIVVAADSLATLSVEAQAIAAGTVACPACGQQHDVQIPTLHAIGLSSITSRFYWLSPSTAACSPDRFRFLQAFERHFVEQDLARRCPPRRYVSNSLPQTWQT
jgi:hypothetical protein